MIPKNDILIFLKGGGGLLGVDLYQPINSIFSKLGHPKEQVGDNVAGFYEYEHGLRFGYFNNEIDELAVMFYGRGPIRIPVEIKGIEEVKEITEKTAINEFIRVLNYAGIKWKGNDEANFEVFSIRTEGNVFVTFDLETGYITKISKERQ